MTKKLTYYGLFKTALLSNELQAAFPAWGGVTSEGYSRMQSKPDKTEVYLFVPDDADEEEIQVVIDAHDSNVLNANEQNEANRDDVRARFLLSQLVDKTPEEIYTLMQDIIDGWGNLGQAKSDLREWLPLMAAVIAWKVIDQELLIVLD